MNWKENRKQTNEFKSLLIMHINEKNC